MIRDPFALLNELEQKPKPVKPSSPKKLYWVIGGLGTLVLVFFVAFLLQYRFQASADTLGSGYGASAIISGIPSQVSSADQLSISLQTKNTGTNLIPASFAIISGAKLDLSATLKNSTTQTEGMPGLLRQVKADEISSLGLDKNENSIYWYIGDLKPGETKSLQISASASGASDGAQIGTKLFAGRTATQACGILGLSKCIGSSGAIMVASQSQNINSTSTGTIKLNAGYNFVSLPYLFTTASAKEFLSSLKDKWAYLYDATTASYTDLNKNDNAGLIKPGVGFWIYDSTGGSYNLPNFKVATSIDEAYSVNLNIGWNQIGNPYSKRVIFSGNNILVKEVADDGSISGAIYSLKTAIDNKILSVPYVVSSKAFTDSNATQNDLSKLLQYNVLSLGSILNPYTGVTISSTKKVVISFPGREVIAPGDLLSDGEKTQIENWISNSGLNQYGDKSGTVYAGGTPLVDPTTAQAIDRYDYIISKHPDKPWLT